MIKEACHFLKISGNLSILLGLSGSCIGWIVLGQKLSDPSAIGPAFAVSIITILYGIMYKIIFYAAEQKIRNKYLEE